MKREIVLVVDDSNFNRSILSKLFSDSYRILEAADGEEAILMVKEYSSQIAIILLDLIMPKVSGLGVLKYLSENGIMTNIPVIMITGEATKDDEKAAYDLGVSEVIRKPIDSYIVKKRVETTIDLYMHKNSLEELVQRQTETLHEQSLRLKKINNQVIETLSTVVEFRNMESGKHIRRIKDFTSVLLYCAAELYSEYNLTPDRIQVISSAATMHDVGKISIPDTILLKPGKLTSDEFAVMKMHTLHGCEIIQSVATKQDDEYFKICYDIARHHHERYDGNGYPDKLSGDDIPFEAQIVAVADVYDALISERVYKKAYSTEQAFNMIMNGECGVFSPKVIECFKTARVKLEELANHKDLNCA